MVPYGQCFYSARQLEKLVIYHQALSKVPYKFDYTAAVCVKNPTGIPHRTYILANFSLRCLICCSNLYIPYQALKHALARNTELFF